MSLKLLNANGYVWCGEVTYESGTVHHCLHHHLETVPQTPVKSLREVRSMLLFPGIRHDFYGTPFRMLLKLS